MKMRILIAIALVLVLLLSGCGAMESAGSAMPAEKENSAVMDSANGSLTESGSPSAGAQTALPVNQKLVRKIWLDAETEDMDALLKNVEERVAQLGGYVESREVENGSIYASRRYRHGSLTIRIPAEKLDSFVDQVSEFSNITSNKETTDDVTLSYVESESRVVALETEQTRLLELLAQAENMEEILQIESRLTDIRAELEKVKSKLRLYDNLVSYGTVYLDITEVKEYTVVEPEPETIWERMGEGIAESWEDMVEGLADALVFIVTVLPHLLPIAAIGGGVVVVILLCDRKKKKKAKKEPPKTE